MIDRARPSSPPPGHPHSALRPHPVAAQGGDPWLRPHPSAKETHQPKKPLGRLALSQRESSPTPTARVKGQTRDAWMASFFEPTQRDGEAEGLRQDGATDAELQPPGNTRGSQRRGSGARGEPTEPSRALRRGHGSWPQDGRDGPSLLAI